MIMRTFFRRPSWATRGDENTRADFYRRSDQTYFDIVAASKEARENLAKEPGHNVANESTGHKRRRISQNGRRSFDDASTPATGERCHQAQMDQEDQFLAVEPKSAASGGNTGMALSPDTTGTSPVRGNCIDSMISDATARRHTGSSSAAPCSSSPNPDEARDMGYQEPDTRQSLENRPDDTIRTGAKAPKDYPAQMDVTIQILITSKIEHTKPLIVQRKISQSLKDVRLAWCNHQNLSPESQSAVYLTWKGKRLFDVTTCKSLGLGLASSFMDDYLPYAAGIARVHMEAVTDITLESSQKRRLSLGSRLTTLNRIVLKCPTLPGLEISISSDARVSELISKFRDARDVSSTQDIYLTFDGDRLKPDGRLADYDIADDDLVDVIIR